MATFFKNSVIPQVGTTPIKVVETASNTRVTVIGLSLANLTDGVVLASVTVQDESSSIGHFIKNVVVPPNSSLRVVNGGEKLVLSSSNSLFIFCDTEAGLDALVSYVEIV